MNTPYVKQFGKDEKGKPILLNGFDKTYLSDSPNRKKRRAGEPKATNNRGKKHIILIKRPFGTDKYTLVPQFIPSKAKYAENLSTLIGSKQEFIGFSKAKTIHHYKLKP